MRAVTHFLRCSAVSLVTTLLALPLALVLWPVSTWLPFAVFITAVMVSTWQGSPRQGLLTTVLSSLILGLLFFASAGQAPGQEQDYVVRLGMFALVGLLASYLSQECKRASRAFDQLQAALSGTGNALLFTDAAGRVTYLNPLAQSLTGWKQPDTLGATFEQVFQAIDAETRQAGVAVAPDVLREGKAAALPEGLVLVSRAGAETPVEGTAAPFPEARGLLVTFREATRRRETRDGVRAHEEQLRQDLEREQAWDRERQDLQARLGEQAARRDEVERALRQEIAGLQAGLREQAQGREQAEEALARVRADLDRHLDEWAIEQERAAEALRDARAEFERQLDARAAGYGQVEEALRAAKADLERRLESQAAAAREAEATVQQLRDELAALQRQAVGPEQGPARADLERRLQEQSAARAHAERSLRQALADAEAATRKWAAQRDRLEETQRQTQEDFERRLEGLMAEHARSQATLEERLAEGTRIEKQLQDERLFLEALTRSIPAGVLAFDADGRCTFWNAAMEQLSGTAESAALGRPARAVLPALDGDGGERILRETLEGQNVRRKLRLPAAAKGAPEDSWEWTGTPLRGQDGEVLGGVAVVRRSRREAAARTAAPDDGNGHPTPPADDDRTARAEPLDWLAYN